MCILSYGISRLKPEKSFRFQKPTLTEIDRLILNFHPGDFFQHSSCVSMGHRKYKYANEICLLCLFTELGAVCLQFREDPKSTNRVKKISKKNF